MLNVDMALLVAALARAWRAGEAKGKTQFEMLHPALPCPGENDSRQGLNDEPTLSPAICQRVA